MAEPARRDPEPPQEASGQPEAKQPKASRFLARLLTPKWLLILLAASVVAHAIGFGCSRLAAKRSAGDLSPEVPLGAFRFAADPAEGGQVAAAEFSLHIAVLSQVEEAARRELRTKRYRVQQAVEELIRRAHSGDFDDPLLGGLKQQLQEKINEVLGIRVIAEVIITEVRLERNPNGIGVITETADALPWTEQPSG